jgi:hypothetical protein
MPWCAAEGGPTGTSGSGEFDSASFGFQAHDRRSRVKAGGGGEGLQPTCQHHQGGRGQGGHEYPHCDRPACVHKIGRGEVSVLDLLAQQQDSCVGLHHRRRCAEVRVRASHKQA